MDNDSNLYCVICRSNKNDIKLVCEHEFCQSCIARMESQKNYTCPVCRQPWKEDEAEGAVAIESTSLCEKIKDFSLDEVVECSEHQKPFVSWCDDCKQLSCVRCLSANHRSHLFYVVDDIVPAMKGNIEDTLLAKKMIMESAMEILKNRDTKLNKLEGEVVALLSAIAKDKETSKEAHEIRSEYLLKTNKVDDLLEKGDPSNIACVYTRCSDIITECPKEELPKVMSDDLMPNLMHHESIAQKVETTVKAATQKVELDYQKKLEEAKAKYQAEEYKQKIEIEALKRDALSLKEKNKFVDFAWKGVVEEKDNLILQLKQEIQTLRQPDHQSYDHYDSDYEYDS